MDNIQQINGKILQYWWIDGIVEMVFSLEMVILAVVYHFFYQVINPILTVFLFGVFLPAIIFGLSIAAGKLIRFLKEKFTYPRTGYVSFRKKSGGRKTRIIIAVIISCITVTLVNFISGRFGENHIWLIIGVLLSITTIFQAFRFGVNRFYILAVLQILLGALVALVSDQTFFASAAVFFFGLGIIWFFSGLFNFIHYLNNYPEVTESEEGDGDYHD
ncbi:MAG: hypothetical protein JXA19_06780 [Anaerolineales bacterium]|nr:hypothetical protein [Anaerolineales bacterium]